MTGWLWLGGRLRSVLRSEDGNLLLLGTFLLIAILGFGGLAVDFGGATELRRKLQVAADIAAREHLAGRDQAALTTLCRTTVPDCAVTIQSDAPVAVVVASAPYHPLFKSLYLYLGISTALEPRARGEAHDNCTLPDPASESRWNSSTAACPTGQTGSITTLTEEARAAVCPAGRLNAVWSDWAATGRTQTTNTCAQAIPVCHDDKRAPRYRWSADRQEACPAGMTYGARYYRVRQVSWPSCDENNDEGWTPWEDVSPEQRYSTANNTCSATCISGSQTKWVEDRRENAVYCPSTLRNEAVIGMNLYGNTYWCSNGVQGSTGWQSRNTWKFLETDCPTGGKAYTTAGAHTWTVPDRVRSVSAVAIGGGASGSVVRSTTATAACGGDNNATTGIFAFGPGETTVVSTPQSVTARGGGYDAVANGTGYNQPGITGGCGGSKAGGGCGGNAGNTPRQWDRNQSWTSGGASFVYGGGGGGAAGYDVDGNAGNGAARDWDNSPKGGYKGGGGGGYHHQVTGGGGGGVTVYSYAANGNWGLIGAPGGGGGSTGESAGPGTDTLSVTSGGTLTAPSGANYGGGGGGVMAAYTACWGADRGYGGGGGELSYRNSQTVIPGGTVNFYVGRGGAAPSPVRLSAGSLSFNVQPGAGARGAARVMWGLGCWCQPRSFPDMHASSDLFDRCPWSNDENGAASFCFPP